MTHQEGVHCACERHREDTDQGLRQSERHIAEEERLGEHNVREQYVQVAALQAVARPDGLQRVISLANQMDEHGKEKGQNGVHDDQDAEYDNDHCICRGEIRRVLIDDQRQARIA